MGFKIKNSFLLVILILLQSCSGGRIGNFLESSFKTIEEPKIKLDTKDNLKNKKIVNSEANVRKNKTIEEPKIKKGNKKDLKKSIKVTKSDLKDGKNKNIKEPIIKENTKKNLKKKITNKPEEKLKYNKKLTKPNFALQKRQFQPQSYKINLIIKDVDPKDPIENLSTILRNSEVNFEIEKIERFFESQNKNIKNN